jgi:hypothetical protein
MADRQDPSQYVFTGGPADGIAALPNMDIVNDQLQPRPEGDYAEAGEMLEFVTTPDHADVPDLIHEKPGRFYTQAPRPTRIVGNYRPISPFGGILIPGEGLIAGFNIHETTGEVPAFLKIHDGNDASAPTMLYISLAPSESTRDWYFPGGLKFKYGVYVEVVSGSIEGVMYSMETEDVQ